MNIWRVNLKPDMDAKYSYDDLLEYCMKNNIIGVGWRAITLKEDNEECLRNFINNIESYDENGKKAAFKAVNAMRKMRTGDLIWTRVGGKASEYYLCRVGNEIWKDRQMNKELEDFDIGNFVSAQWVKVGNEDKVPGKVVNSFCVPSTIQPVYEVENISKNIWNELVKQEKKAYELYDIEKLQLKDFWQSIGSEDLECLVLLYLQSKGYYIYSSTLKRSSPQFEAVMVYKDGSHRAYPQVKRESELRPSNYTENIGKEDKIFLFSSSENYGGEMKSNVECITRKELEDFISKNKKILPTNITYWLKCEI